VIKKLTAPLTFILSRKGRERKKRKGSKKFPLPLIFPIGGKRKRLERISSRTSSPLTGEDKGGGEKELTSPLTLTLSRRERGRAKRKELKEFLLIPSSRLAHLQQQISGGLQKEQQEFSTLLSDIVFLPRAIPRTKRIAIAKEKRMRFMVFASFFVLQIIYQSPGLSLQC
jgi:hypothetical protein